MELVFQHTLNFLSGKTTDAIVWQDTRKYYLPVEYCPGMLEKTFLYQNMICWSKRLDQKQKDNPSPFPHCISWEKNRREREEKREKTGRGK